MTVACALLRPVSGTVVQFAGWHPDDAACLDYLAWLRFGDAGFGCYLCGAVGRGWLRADGTSWDCGACGSRTSATAGTIFHRTRTPLTVWFRAAWELTTRANGVSARGIQRSLELGTYQTAWTMLHRFHLATVMPSRAKLGGIVEVDDMFVGGRNKPGMAGPIASPAQDAGADDGRGPLARYRPLPGSGAPALGRRLATRGAQRQHRAGQHDPQ
jgi:hypothetical protein